MLTPRDRFCVNVLLALFTLLVVVTDVSAQEAANAPTAEPRTAVVVLSVEGDVDTSALRAALAEQLARPVIAVNELSRPVGDQDVLASIVISGDRVHFAAHVSGRNTSDVVPRGSSVLTTSVELLRAVLSPEHARLMPWSEGPPRVVSAASLKPWFRSRQEDAQSLSSPQPRSARR